MVFPFFCLPQCSIRSMFCTLFLISLCAVLHVWMFQQILNFVDNVNVMMSASKLARRLASSNSAHTKYILLWDKLYLFINKNGESIFPSLNCSVKDCLVTTDRNMVDDFSRFDGVLFSDQILTSEERPAWRSPSQIFVFATYESPQNHPACEIYNDDFFNWTLTYRLDSDVIWNYFVVRNRSNVVVAPRVDVTWEEGQGQLRPEIKAILQKKRKTAAWIVSHCNAGSHQDEYLMKLQRHLYHFSLKIDVYGSCSQLKCPNDNCDEMLARNYQFYMAFENTINEDYVTEKVMNGYRNYAVPVVYGGANYSKFLPPGSYINARETHPYNLAFAIYEATRNPSVFESYFKWTNVYSIEDIGTQGNHPLCNLCAALHDKRARHAPAKKYFRVWWNTLNGMKWCLSGEYWNENALLNFDETHDSLNLY